MGNYKFCYPARSYNLVNDISEWITFPKKTIESRAFNGQTSLDVFKNAAFLEPGDEIQPDLNDRRSLNGFRKSGMGNGRLTYSRVCVDWNNSTSASSIMQSFENLVFAELIK